MTIRTNQNIAQERLRCVYCKKVLDESASFYELEYQVHISCKLQIEDYKAKKLPKDVHKELQAYFKEFNITHYRFLNNKEMYNLRTLNLNNSQITYIHPKIHYLSNLQALGVANNKLQELPVELGQMVQLKALNLSYNNFEDIPPIVRKLPYIQKFMYAGNRLEEYPEIINELTSLEQLDLSDNKLQDLPKSITKLQSLKEFYGQINRLEEIPEGLRGIKGLQTIHLAQNSIRELPNWLEEKHYYYVNVTDNPIENIDKKLKRLQAVMLNRVVLQSEMDEVRKRMG